jgi:hypothetical protein
MTNFFDVILFIKTNFKTFFINKIYSQLTIKWGLGIGDWGLGIGPNPQSPIPNPQSPIPNLSLINFKKIIKML